MNLSSLQQKTELLLKEFQTTLSEIEEQGKKQSLVDIYEKELQEQEKELTKREEKLTNDLTQLQREQAYTTRLGKMLSGEKVSEITTELQDLRKKQELLDTSHQELEILQEKIDKRELFLQERERRLRNDATAQEKKRMQLDERERIVEEKQRELMNLYYSGK